MTARERNLSLLLGAAFVIILLMVGVRWFRTQSRQLNGDIKKYQQQVDQKEGLITLAEASEEFRDWLERYEPDRRRSPGEVKSELLDFCSKRIQLNGLEETKGARPTDLPSEGHYSRARVILTVQGSERDVISFVSAVTSPRDFRNVARLELKPQAGDETNARVDATIEVDQWYLEASAEELLEGARATEESASASPVPALPSTGPKPPALPPGLEPNTP